MKPDENPEVVTTEKKFLELVKVLAPSSITEDDLIPLHMWLSVRAGDQRLEQVISSVVDNQTHREQIEVSEEMARCAAFIAAQFGGLKGLSPLNELLSNSFSKVLSNDGPSMPSHSSVGEHTDSWGSFHWRINADSTLLAKIATETKACLQNNPAKRGRKARDWRNKLFDELVTQVSTLTSGSRSKLDIAEIATKAWNIYFVSGERFIDEESAQRNVRRTRKKKREGH